MFDVIVDPDVRERVASRLDLWASELTSRERAHLVALLGVGSAALAGAIAAVRGLSSIREVQIRTNMLHPPGGCGLRRTQRLATTTSGHQTLRRCQPGLCCC